MKGYLALCKEVDKQREEIDRLKRLVDALCVSLVNERGDANEERVRMTLRSPAGTRGWRVFSDGLGQAKWDELEGQRQMLIEDYPNLRRGS